MAAVAVVAPLPVIRAAATWQYGDPSLTDLRLSLLDRGQSDGVTRRKRTGSSRSRHSWRWSWKQMLTKPFQNQTWTRGGSLRAKGNRKKRKSESQNISKSSVETRKKMDELYRIWLCDVDESSEESSDDELSERNRRRSCYPRIFGSDTSSSDSEDEHQVSQYVREGPSRINVDTIREEERISEDIGRMSDTSSASDSSSEINLIQTEKQGTIEQVVDLNNPDTNGHQNILRQNESVERCEVMGIKRDNYVQQSLTVSQPIAAQSLKECKVIEIKGNTVNLEPQIIIVSHPTTQTAQIKAIAIPEYRHSTNYESQSNTASKTTAKSGNNKEIGTVELPNTTNYGPQLITVSGQLADQNKEIVEGQNSLMNSNVVSHDYLGTQEVTSKGGGEQTDRINPGVMTSTRGMINNYHNDRVISARQIYHKDILKRVDELCAQCGEEVYCNNEIKFESYGAENGRTYHDNTGFTPQEGEMKKYCFDENSYVLESPQEGWRKESSDKPIKDVAPDYPSSYPKTGTHYQMSSQNEEQYSKLHCEFNRFGCLFTGTSMAVDQHMQSSLNDHLKLVSKLAQDQKEQLESQQLEQQKQSLLIQQLTDTVNNLEKLVREQNQATQSQEKTVHTLKDQMKDQRKQSQRFEREITNQIQALNQSSTSSLPTSPCAAEFVWPIRNFRKRLRRIQDGEIDDPLISEPFYTGTYGYKLSIWVYLNGRGKTLGDWISVYARVMPSDHDNILSWPVRPMYTFTLLDQAEGEKEHIVRKRKVNDIKRDGGKHHGIHRPEGGERSVIVGFDDFVAHAQLEKRKYIFEDCIYLKLEANIMH